MIYFHETGYTSSQDPSLLYLLSKWRWRLSIGAMVSGALDLGNVGRVTHIIVEKSLRELTGNHQENPTVDLPCREIFARQQKGMAVAGTLREPGQGAVGSHEGCWN